MSDWILFGITVFSAAAGAVGVWFGLAVKAALAPLQERVSVLENQVEEHDRRLTEQAEQQAVDQRELVRVMEKGFAELSTRLDRVDGRIDRAINGKGERVKPARDLENR